MKKTTNWRRDRIDVAAFFTNSFYFQCFKIYIKLFLPKEKFFHPFFFLHYYFIEKKWETMSYMIKRMNKYIFDFIFLYSYCKNL